MSDKAELERVAKINQQVRMFGMPREDMKESLKGQCFGNPLMLSMQILSDAQHVMEQGDVETARQFINKSKWVISKCMEQAMNQNIKFTLEKQDDTH